MSNPTTVKEAMAFLRQFNMIIRKTDDEFRVNFKGGDEATAYYTTDLEDAIDTAKQMATRFKAMNKTHEKEMAL